MMNNKKTQNRQFTFKTADKSHRELIHAWLHQDYINEWIHGQGLKRTLEELDLSFKGLAVFHHWIAYNGEEPFGYLITTNVDKKEGDYSKFCHREGRAITLDVFICDPKYLGKGFGVRMIEEFLLSQPANVTDVFIDPEVKNERAVHVYKKVGFHIIKEFIASWHPVPHYQMHLDLKKLLTKFK